MNLELVLEAFRESLPTSESIQATPVLPAETCVHLPPECIRPAVTLLLNRFDIYHLSAITGLDTGSEIQLLYHFWEGQGLTLRVSLSRDGAHISTLADLIPGAAFYEREASEMLGVVFDGHPGMRSLLLPDDWDGDPPLHQGSELTPSQSAGMDGCDQ